MTDVHTNNGTSHDQHQPGKTGAPKGNQNAIRHGLRAGKLPSGCRYIENTRNELRRQIEDEILATRGIVTIAEAATLQSLLRHETRCQLLQRWLRLAEKEDEPLSILERAALLRDISASSDQRDKCIRQLRLDCDEETINIPPGVIFAEPSGTESDEAVSA